MASTFKTLLNDDVVSTRTLLHEAIPITGTIMSGTTYDTKQIKTYTHGMFESTFDYPYLSSSANHLLDITYGHSPAVFAHLSGTQQAGYQVQKKRDIYNQFAQVLMGYDESGSIRTFDSDGTLNAPAATTVANGEVVADAVGTMHHCFFLSFARLLVKDEVKKGSFRLDLKPSGSLATPGVGSSDAPDVDTSFKLGDYSSNSEYFTSPAGDYGLIFKADADKSDPSKSVGLIFYQAGVVILTGAIFHDPVAYAADDTKGGALTFGYSGSEGSTSVWGAGGALGGNSTKADGVLHAQASGSIENLAQGFRNRWVDCNFNNTIELNSTIYFARINHNEFNYSSNPTYVSSGKLVVKNNVSDLPVTYLTTVGLYSPDNELLAVAKLSEPIRKDPNTELTLRVRLDY